MRFFIFFIILSSLSSFFCFETGAYKLNVSVDIKKAVWKVEDSEGKVQGSGVVIDNRFFVTALHVIAPVFRESDPVLDFLSYVGMKSTIKDKDIILSQKGNSSSLRIKRVVGMSYAYDLAILEIEGEVEHSLSLRKSSLKYEEPVLMLGYPHGEFVEMKSKLSSEDILHYQFHIRRGFYTNGEDNVRGASGGPVLDSGGQVVGILVEATNSDGTVIGSMTERIDVIKVNFLKKLIQNTQRRLRPLTADLQLRRYIRDKIDELYSFAERSPLYQYILAKKQKDAISYVNEMKKAAIKGFPDAQYELALYYLESFIFEQEEEQLRKGFYWMKRAAGSGNLVLAQYELARMYTEEGDKQNFERSFYWMKKAAENKRVFPKAEYGLAAKYDEGEGIERNPKQSLYWMKRAAEHNLPEAQYELAVQYERGDGVKKSLERSFYWMRRAAKQGLREAEYELAVKYEKGEGIDRDFERSFYWMKRAADKGSQEAQYELAIKYEKGEGIEKNSELAQRYFELAAKGGHPLAQRRCSGAF